MHSTTYSQVASRYCQVMSSCLALTAADVPQPQWVIVPSDQLESAETVGYPLVLKRPSGALRKWNRLVERPDDLAQTAAELLTEGGGELLAQEAVVVGLGTSVRVVALGNEVLAATELRTQPGEWRSNGALGSIGTDVTLDDDEHAAAIGALAAVGLSCGCVDLIRAGGRALVLEVSAGSPFIGAERRTGRNIAGLVLDFLLTAGEPERKTVGHHEH